MHNYFSVIETTPTQVTLKADNTLGISLLTNNQPVIVTFTALESSGITFVSHSYKGDVRKDSPIDKRVQNVYNELAKRFNLIP
ncbi:hypothetical protein Dxin01_04277 [Deinococcus xinjiangensis]|uniref:Uncharacterized protein n=2 Tax=Deinococcus xinjiangensis TaxID=457454 RepID=A0ABP9VLE7_9DEIO